MATVYNVGKIKEDVPSSAKLIAVVGSQALDGSPSNDIILNEEPIVNNIISESGEDNAQNSVLQSGANSENTSENGVDIYKSQSQRTWLWHNNLCGSYRN